MQFTESIDYGTRPTTRGHRSETRVRGQWGEKVEAQSTYVWSRKQNLVDPVRAGRPRGSKSMRLGLPFREGG